MNNEANFTERLIRNTLKSAEEGNSKSMVGVAMAYISGAVLGRDIPKAVQWLKKSVNLGNIDAMLYLANMYKKGKDIKQDYGEAFRLRSMIRNLTEERYFSSLDKTLELRRLLELHQKDDTLSFNDEDLFGLTTARSAICQLGEMYEQGLGIEQNLSEAYDCYNKAAAAGDKTAYYHIGYFYRYGKFLKQDLKLAFECFSQGNNYDSEAEFELGIMYEEGLYVRKNIAKAVDLYINSAYARNIKSMNRLGNIFGRKRSISEDLVAIFNFFINQAPNGDIDVMAFVAECYKNGNGVIKNLNKAIHWHLKAFESFEKTFQWIDASATQDDYKKVFDLFLKSAQAGNFEAMDVIGDMYGAGKGTEKNLQKAFEWYLKSTESGNLAYIRGVAYCYLKGKGIEKDYKKALDGFLKSANNGRGDCYAMYWLGEMYRTGEGVDKNFKKALNWYEKAFNAGSNGAKKKIKLMYRNGEISKQDLPDNFEIEQEEESAIANNSNNEKADEFYEKGLSYYKSSKATSRKDTARKYQFEAIKNFEKSGEAGNVEAMYKAGQVWNDIYNFIIELSFDSPDYVFYKPLFPDYNGKNLTSQISQKVEYWYSKATENNHAEAKEALEKFKKRGSCFITTAVCGNFGKSDDCYELTAFRKFRDTWLINQPDGKSLIDEYYRIAPQIVSNISHSENSSTIYENIWKDYLAPCLSFIETDQNQSCKLLYIEMVNSLKQKYL